MNGLINLNIDFMLKLAEIEDDLKSFATEVKFTKNENLSVLAVVDHNFCNDY